jgi:hypothetical protein
MAKALICQSVSFKLSDLQLSRLARTQKIIGPQAAIELEHIVPIFHVVAHNHAKVVQRAGIQKLRMESKWLVAHLQVYEGTFRQLCPPGRLVFPDRLTVGFIPSPKIKA